MQIILIKIYRFFRLIARFEMRELVDRLRKRLLRLQSRYIPARFTAEKPLSIKDQFLHDAAVAFDDFLYSKGRIALSTSQQPEVTILLVLFNKVELTYLCLKSLAMLGSRLKFAVVIIDNASEDRTNRLLERVDGAVIVKNTKNVGFLRACNQGRAFVQSPYLLLLNNDTEVPPGSIEIALQTFKETDRCGAVGGRLVRPDHTLQEAGNILWNDGTCVGYLRNSKPSVAEAMYRRETDYCSGAFLLTRTDYFNEIGFDERYIPAYYEETDFCVELKKRGLKIIYEPRALIHHFEYGSAGPSAKAMEQMAINCSKFREKHREFLDKLPAPCKNPSDLVYYRAPSGKKRILFIEDVPPNAAKGAGFPRANMIINLMHDLGYEVTVYTTFYAPESWAVVYRDLPIDVEVIFGRGFDGLHPFLLNRAHYFDFIWIGRPHNMDYFTSACLKYRRNSKIPVIYDSEAIFSERLKLLLEVNTNKEITPSYVHNETQREYRLASHASAIVSVSEYEAGIWRSHFSGPIHVLGHDCDLVENPAPFGSREGIAFLGTIYGMSKNPNWDSLTWYIDEVMPRLRDKYHLSHKLILVGNCTVSKKSMSYYAKHIEIVGSVDNLKDALDRYRILVVPTRYAAGIPQKVFDATKYGIPTVCTSLIANQMTWSDGNETLACDWRDPDGFAKRCVDLYQNEELWNKIQRNARDWMANQPNRDALKSHLSSILRSFQT